MVMVVDEEGAERRQSASVRIQGVKRCFRVGADPKRISTPPPPLFFGGSSQEEGKTVPRLFRQSINRLVALTLPAPDGPMMASTSAIRKESCCGIEEQRKGKETYSESFCHGAPQKQEGMATENLNDPRTCIH